MVKKFAPVGRLVMHMDLKPESVDGPSSPYMGRGTPPGSGAQSDLFQSPTDVAWDADGNIFVAEWVQSGRVTKLRKVS